MRINPGFLPLTNPPLAISVWKMEMYVLVSARIMAFIANSTCVELV